MAFRTSEIKGMLEGIGMVTPFNSRLSMHKRHGIDPSFSLKMTGLFHKLVDFLITIHASSG